MNDEPAANLPKILQSPSYRVAYKDVDFLAGPELRAVRLELELLKPELYFQKHNIRSTIVVFGSTRIVEPAAARRQTANRPAKRWPPRRDDRLRQRAVAQAERLLERSHYYDNGPRVRPAGFRSCQDRRSAIT